MDQGDRMYTKNADGTIQTWYVWSWFGPRFAVTPTRYHQSSGYTYKAYYHMNDIGKTIFLTRKEAKEA